MRGHHAVTLTEREATDGFSALLEGGRPRLTIGGGVAQNLSNVLVGWVLAQGAHDVSHLVVGHLVVTDSVKETESLLEV